MNEDSLNKKSWQNPIPSVLCDVESLLVLLVRHELDSGVGYYPRHCGRVPAPQTEQTGVGVGHVEELEGAEDAVTLVRVSLKVDLGAVQRRYRRLGKRAGQRSGGHIRENHLRRLEHWRQSRT